ncbi:MAG: GGDEF domain-containing protein [Endomicrobiales bacterium]|nr:GGDEF domain-containing protein [Endomicrobiales bacterium]
MERKLFFRNISRTKTVLLGLAFTALFGLLDFYTTPDIAPSVFYALPVAFTAWYASVYHGFFISVICVVSEYSVHTIWPRYYENPVMLYWNLTAELMFFFVISYIVSTLGKTLDSEKSLARTDPLTGTANTRYFYELADIEIKRAQRTKKPLTIAFIDIDNFKVINDTYGHTEGDRLLKKISETIKGSIRAIDILSRIGGDEFVLVFPDTDFERAKQVLTRLKKDVDDIVASLGLPATLSVGAASCSGLACSVDSLIKVADNLMYSVKATGKNNLKVTSVGSVCDSEFSKTCLPENNKQKVFPLG